MLNNDRKRIASHSLLAENTADKPENLYPLNPS